LFLAKLVLQPNQLVSHKIISTLPLPEITSQIYEYLFAGNGVFIRAIRPGLEAIAPVEIYQNPIRGLPSIAPQLSFNYPQIPKYILLTIWEHSRSARDGDRELMETLFYLNYEGECWRLRLPKQFQAKYSCRPKQLYQEASVELHSHGNMDAFFSSTDDKEENGFRIYSVIGKLDSNYPEIKVRIGLFGYFWNIPADYIFELPYFFTDTNNKTE
jgi:PRTRC genetic system protein A